MPTSVSTSLPLSGPSLSDTASAATPSTTSTSDSSPSPLGDQSVSAPPKKSPKSSSLKCSSCRTHVGNLRKTIEHENASHGLYCSPMDCPHCQTHFPTTLDCMVHVSTCTSLPKNKRWKEMGSLRRTTLSLHKSKREKARSVGPNPLTRGREKKPTPDTKGVHTPVNKSSIPLTRKSNHFTPLRPDPDTTREEEVDSDMLEEEKKDTEESVLETPQEGEAEPVTSAAEDETDSEAPATGDKDETDPEASVPEDETDQDEESTSTPLTPHPKGSRGVGRVTSSSCAASNTSPRVHSPSLFRLYNASLSKESTPSQKAMPKGRGSMQSPVEIPRGSPGPPVSPCFLPANCPTPAELKQILLPGRWMNSLEIDYFTQLESKDLGGAHPDGGRQPCVRSSLHHKIRRPDTQIIFTGPMDRGHFSLLVLNRDLRIEYHDSFMDDSTMDEVMVWVYLLFDQDIIDKGILIVDVEQQDATKPTCGLHALARQHWYLHNLPTVHHLNNNKLRSHYVMCVQKGATTAFPTLDTTYYPTESLWRVPPREQLPPSATDSNPGRCWGSGPSDAPRPVPQLPSCALPTDGDLKVIAEEKEDEEDTPAHIPKDR
ncbi:hypothetical protein KIPB_012153, partial [Kipferlia bialata]|eukprot:g12153.t1